jgi:hypothetical protein
MYAVRRASIKALRSLTGRRFGYDPTAGNKRNETAIVRWTAYVLSKPGR